MLLNMGLGNDFFESDNKKKKKIKKAMKAEINKIFKKIQYPSLSSYYKKFKKMIYSQIHSMRPPLPWN